LAVQARQTGNRQPFRLLDVQLAKELRRFRFGNGGKGLAILPGGNELVYLDGWSALLRKLNDGAYRELPGLEGLGNHPVLAQSSDGRFLVFGHLVRDKDVGGLRLWEAVTKKTVWLVETGKMDPTSVAFSADGRTIVMGSLDGHVGVWDARSGRLLERFTGHQGEVRAIAFSRDGKRLASGSADTTILTWDIAKTMSRPRPPAVRLKEDEIRDLWTRLSSDDAPAAQRAVWRLVDAGEQTTSFLAKELGGVDDKQRLRQVRAVQVLESIGSDAAIRLLKQAADKHLSAQLRGDAKAALNRLRARAAPR